AKYQALWREKQDLDAKLQELRTKVRRGESESAARARAEREAEEFARSAGQAFDLARTRAQEATNSWGDARAAAQSARDDVVRISAQLEEAARLPTADLDLL